MSEHELTPEQKAGRYWDWLRGMYGTALRVQFGEEMPRAWVGTIGALTIDELRVGCRALRDREGRYPPTVPEFIALCRPHREPMHQPALPPPGRQGRGVTEVGLAHLAAWRETRAKAAGMAAAHRAKFATAEEAALDLIKDQDTAAAVVMRKWLRYYQERRAGNYDYRPPTVRPPAQRPPPGPPGPERSRGARPFREAGR